ncbi:hypothetical protein FRB99_006833 [Tulasnella sp. 403]|nr:hypothetical protein FRB99_006833 [Tulasnella sp. 403]
MANLIARLPSIRRDGAMGSDTRIPHQRLNSPPPSPHLEEADLAALPEDSTVDKFSGEGHDRRKSKRKWKGKGKATPEDERRLSRPASVGVTPEVGEGENDGADAERGTRSSDSYPPTNDEDLETRRIQETLKRWEMLELQRRKAARDSRASRTPSSIMSDVAGYVTNLGTKPSSRRRDTANGSADAGHRSSKSGGWIEASSRDSLDIQMEDKRATSTADALDIQRTTSPPPITSVSTTPTTTNFPRQQPTRRLSQSSTKTDESASTITSSPNNPFSNRTSNSTDAEVGPHTPTNTSFQNGKTGDILPPPRVQTRSSSTAVDEEGPFRDPSLNASKLSLDAPLLESPTQLSPIASPKVGTRQHFQGPSSTTTTSPTYGEKAHKRMSSKPPPLVRPLDLPEAQMPRMEPIPETGHWRRVQHARQREQELREEEENDRLKGRWWTDWICGCRESHRREEQDFSMD